MLGYYINKRNFDESLDTALAKVRLRFGADDTLHEQGDDESMDRNQPLCLYDVRDGERDAENLREYSVKHTRFLSFHLVASRIWSP